VTILPSHDWPCDFKKLDAAIGRHLEELDAKYNLEALKRQPDGRTSIYVLETVVGGVTARLCIRLEGWRDRTHVVVGEPTVSTPRPQLSTDPAVESDEEHPDVVALMDWQSDVEFGTANLRAAARDLLDSIYAEDDRLLQADLERFDLDWLAQKRAEQTTRDELDTSAYGQWQLAVTKDAFAVLVENMKADLKACPQWRPSRIEVVQQSPRLVCYIYLPPVSEGQDGILDVADLAAGCVLRMAVAPIGEPGPRLAQANDFVDWMDTWLRTNNLLQNICSDIGTAQPVPSPPEAAGQAQTETPSDLIERIPDREWDRKAVRLWRERKKCDQIAETLSLSPRTVRNRLCALRKEHGVEVVPRRRS
jgi:hypothetical protein